MTKREELVKQANELALLEVLVETNAGTFGAAEACRKVGTGQPEFAEYKVYERVGDGQRRRVGCDAERAPGYARHFVEELADRRAALADLRKQLQAKGGA